MAQIYISHPFPFSDPKDHIEITAYMTSKGYTTTNIGIESEAGEICVHVEETLTQEQIDALIVDINSDGNNCRITNP